MATKVTKLFSSFSVVITKRLIVTSPLNEIRNWNRLKLIKDTFCNTATMASSATDPNVTATDKSDDSSPKVEAPQPDANVPQSTVPVPDTETQEHVPNKEPTSNPVSSTTGGDRRVRKVKAALLLSYSGQGYFGMQMQNSGARTIENDLMKAFLEAGVLDKEGFEKPKSQKFQRAARTDKNVSAAKNIVSLLVPKDLDVDSVNKHLPDQIRVMDYRRVTKGFDAKNTCCARTYLYMIPTFAFAPLEQAVTESYRITPEVLENLRKILKMYIGTKNYHNFTSRKKPTDPSAIRFIMDFESSEPFLKDGLEFVVLKVKGQSFMLHQIRKMIGLAVAIMRGCATEETLKKSFKLERIDIPMAPGLGLMLGEVHYDHYNKKFGKDGFHEAIVWDNVADKVEEFCQTQIYTQVTRTENEEKSMFNWLETVPYHSYDIREDTSKGGFGPLGRANLLAKYERGEASEEDLDDDEDEDDLPKKKQKLSA